LQTPGLVAIASGSFHKIYKSAVVFKNAPGDNVGQGTGDVEEQVIVRDPHPFDPIPGNRQCRRLVSRIYTFGGDGDSTRAQDLFILLDDPPDRPLGQPLSWIKHPEQKRPFANRRGRMIGMVESEGDQILRRERVFNLHQPAAPREYAVSSALN
jgi:hypothetical protein